MALNNIFAGESGSVPGTQLDQNFNAIGNMTVTQCAVTGGTANAIEITQNANQPAFAFGNFQLLSFQPTALPTGPVTIALNGNSAAGLVWGDGSTPCSANAWANENSVILVAFSPGADEFILVNVLNAPGQIPGTQTNDDAAAGAVGEFISASLAVGAAVSLTSNTPANVTSISLTAGDWDVEGTTIFSTGTATMSEMISSVNKVSATLPANNGGGYANTGFLSYASGAANALTLPTGSVRMPLATTTTVFLVAQATISSSTAKAYGFIRARRPR